jgi:hypothetical protein
MKTLPIPSLALGVCLLALSAGVAFADNLRNPAITTGFSIPPPGAGGGSPGQTGSNAIATCSGTPSPVGMPNTGNLGSGNLVSPGVIVDLKSNTGAGSPFNPADLDKAYAGNTAQGNPAGTRGSMNTVPHAPIRHRLRTAPAALGVAVF